MALIPARERANGQSFPIWKGMMWIGILAVFFAMATRAPKSWNRIKWAGAIASTGIVLVVLVPVFLFWLWATYKPNRALGSVSRGCHFAFCLA
jgi:protein-S-isoprenylcysteine O-methyltransferase Ste14